MNETDIYSEADARAWATHYCALNNGSDVPTMQTWFEGAMDAVRKAEVEPLETQDTRYRAALEEISNHRGTPTAGGYSVCDWCGVSVETHRPDCAAAIARRALHPEEEE